MQNRISEIGSLLRERALLTGDRPNETSFKNVDVLHSLAEIYENMRKVHPEVGVQSDVLNELAIDYYKTRPPAMDQISDCGSSIDERTSGTSVPLGKVCQFLVDSLLLKVEEPPPQDSEGQFERTLLLWHQDPGSYSELHRRRQVLECVLEDGLRIREYRCRCLFYRGRPAIKLRLPTPGAALRAFRGLAGCLAELQMGSEVVLSRVVLDRSGKPPQGWCAVVVRYLPREVTRHELLQRF
jgi:hypothetical protein